LAGPVAKKRGPVTRVPDSRDKRIADVERENLRWLRRAERAEALVELTGDSGPDLTRVRLGARWVEERADCRSAMNISDAEVGGASA
jgi:hypothetical protein